MFKDNPKLKNIFFLGFLLALHLAFTSYINSSFLSLYSPEKYVSLIYITGSLFSIVMLFFIPQILKKFGGKKFLLWSSGLNALSLLLLATLKNPLSIVALFIFYFTLNHLIIFALDELLEIFSKHSSEGTTRGLYLTTVNLAWILAQAISGETLTKFSFSTLYLVGFFIMATFFFSTLWSLRNFVDPKYDKVFAWQSVKKFFSDKNLSLAYIRNFLLQFFYVWMVIYTPLYLNTYIGFSWKEIATIFMIMLTPFVLLQFPLGKYSDKIGERKMLMFGFFIASISTLSLFFIHEHKVWIWALALFCTRVGASIIEVMNDVYFFKHIQKENDEFISIYRNAIPGAYIVGPLLAFIAFYLIPSFNFIFLILGTVMLYGVYLASKIRRSDI